MTSGRFGWVPFNRGGSKDAQTRSGDVLAIFPRCTSPIVLRTLGGRFQVVGGAYVHGMMEGELAELVERGECQMQEIWLC